MLEKEIKKTKPITEFSYGKIPPQSRELEEAVLGAIMIDYNCLPTVVNEIFSDVFYFEDNRVIYEAILSLYDKNRKIDIITIVEELKRVEKLDFVGGAWSVAKITNNVVSSAHIEEHCRILKEHYLKREMIIISSNALSNSYENSVDAFELYDKTDNSLLVTQEKVLKGLVKNMDYYSMKVHDEYENVKSKGVLGILTHLANFNKILSGLVAPDLIILAARPSQGKTSIALSITHFCSILNKIPCAWFSLEMDGIQLARRFASIDSGIAHERIRQGKLTEEEELIFFNSLDKINSSPIYIEDNPSVNVRAIRTRANVLKRKHDIQYIVVDYLQLMNGIDTRNKSRNDIIGEISRGLKILAKELKIPVIALSQLSREVEKRADKMPQMSDLRESGSIEQDADSVIFIMRPEKYGFTEPVIIGGTEYDVKNLTIVKVDKNRHGECKNFPLFFNGELMHIVNHPKDMYNNGLQEQKEYFF